jgi:hypothetical protein
MTKPTDSTRSGGRWVDVPVEDAGAQVRIEVREGTSVATGLHIETVDPLTTTLLRTLSAPDLLAAALSPDAGTDTAPGDPLTYRPGSVGHSADDLAEVLAIYADALRTHPRSPMTWTAKILDRSVAQTRRIVRQAEQQSKEQS